MVPSSRSTDKGQFSENLLQAIAACKKLLGERNVILETEKLDAYCRDITPYEPKTPAVLLPVSVQEVQGIVEIANNHSVPIYPVSRGRNWGYGAACPIKEGQIVVDLRRLNQIVEVNEDLAYAVIEPGVTQAQLSKYLKETKSNLFLDVTGGPPDASVVGNILERGLGFGRYCDHNAASCGMEVVLANGEILQTGFGHFEDALATHVHKDGLGPSLDGLFAQSNLGIVTQMTVWLMKKPDITDLYFFECSTQTDMLKTLQVLRDLKIEGTLEGNVHIGSPARMNMMLNSAKTDTERWTGSGALWGNRAVVAAKKKRIRQAFKNARIRWISHAQFGWLTKHPWLVKLLTGKEAASTLPLLASLFDWAEGTPSADAVKGLYYRLNRTVEKPINPIEDGCGQYWFSPILPCEIHALDHALWTYNDIFKRWGMAFDVTIHLATERAVTVVLSIGFDKRDKNSTNNAAKCYRQLLAASKKMGVIPYRTGIETMNLFVDRNDPFWDTFAKIKQALDPKNILAPGKWAPKQPLE